MKGIIFLWYGAIVDIPDGWALCNGSQGTPGMWNRFPVGAGSSYNPGNTGGAKWHNHAFTGDGHVHNVALGSLMAIGGDLEIETSEDPAVGVTNNASIFPPYKALAYIMKLP